MEGVIIRELLRIGLIYDISIVLKQILHAWCIQRSFGRNPSDIHFCKIWVGITMYYLLFLYVWCLVDSWGYILAKILGVINMKNNSIR
jgi:hypothetical protein